VYQQVYIHYFNELLVKDEKLGEIHAIKLILQVQGLSVYQIFHNSMHQKVNILHQQL
jgi:hypothetical protein